jgi:hypothetical protein
MERFVSVKRDTALELLEDEDYTTEVRKVGRHFFVKTDAPLERRVRLFYDAKGRLVDNGPNAEFCLTLDYQGDVLLSVDSAFVD